MNPAIQNDAEVYDQTLDPVLVDFPLDMRVRIYPLGFPLDLRTNSHDVVRTARSIWGPFKQKFDEVPMRIDLGVLDNGSRELPPMGTCRVRGHLLTSVYDANNFSVVDCLQGFAYAWITPFMAKRLEVEGYRMLEALVHHLLVTQHVVSLHAACISLHGSGVLLGGDSRAGKTTLAYACARSGWQYLCDDGSFLVRKLGGRTVLGNPNRVRFREDAIELFPEVRAATKFALDGKPRIEIATAALPHIETITEARIDHVVFLKRRAGAKPRFRAVSKASLPYRLDWGQIYGLESIRDGHQNALDELLDTNLVEFEYSDLAEAVPALESLVEAGRLGAASWSRPASA